MTIIFETTHLEKPETPVLGGKHMTKATIVNCHEAGIRKYPEDPNRDKEVVGIVKAGDTVKIDQNKTTYDWVGDQFYYCEASIGAGWINTNLVSIGG